MNRHRFRIHRDRYGLMSHVHYVDGRERVVLMTTVAGRPKASDPALKEIARRFHHQPKGAANE